MVLQRRNCLGLLMMSRSLTACEWTMLGVLENTALDEEEKQNVRRMVRI